MKFRTCISRVVAASLLVLCSLGVRAATPRVAVWDPVKGTQEGRFKIDLVHLDQVTQWLRSANIAAERVTSEQINDPAAFSAQKYDALLLPGDAFPRANTKALQLFADGGGVLVALGAKVPFNVAIETQKNGEWTMSPKEPRFAWQSGDIYNNTLGMRYVYNPAKHDQGVQQTATPLLKKYLPQAPNFARKMPSYWVVPATAGDVRTEYYPLVRSRRLDGADTVPQLFVVKNGKRLGIISVNEVFTRAADPALWPLAKETVVALARLARDLRDDPTLLTPAMKIDLPENLPPPEPLRHRIATGSVEPEGAKPLLRWGKFDGTSFELGEPLGPGKIRELAPDGSNDPFPRSLQPGASVTLTIPRPQPGTHYLRVRGAYTATGAGLKATWGDQTIWNERFNYVESGGTGNMSAPDLLDVPAEFHRIVYLPPAAQTQATLTLSNAGDQPVFFDAIQIETRTRPAPERIVGLGAGFDVMRTGKASVVKPDVSGGWSAIRASARTQLVGPPGDPERWAKFDTLLAKYGAMKAPVELLLEGTPAWSAVSPERHASSGGRPHTVAPNPDKYAEIVARIVQQHGDHINAYEIWNEADSQQFYRGTTDEYLQLFKTIVPVIRKHDPSAKIITTGMAGFKEAFVRELVASGAMGMADLVAFHPYAGKSPAWDMPFGQIEGSLFSLGIDREIYCNESGFVWHNSEWFTSPPAFTPAIQADLLDKAMARVLANGLAKLSVFHAGGDTHPFGLIDEKGVPRPAYAVFADYLPLGQKSGRRLDVSLVRADGAPLQGVYAAASAHADGGVTVVVNPAEVDALKPVVLRNPSTEFDDNKGWIHFNGKAALENGQVTLTPDAGKEYVGFYAGAAFDPARSPIVEVHVPETAKFWQMALKVNNKQVAIATDQKAGIFRADLRPLLAQAGVAGGKLDGEITFRVWGKTTLDYVRFLKPDGTALPKVETIPGPLKEVPVLLRVPLKGGGTYRASLRTGGKVAPVALTVREAAGQSWAELMLPVSARSLVTITPDRRAEKQP